MVKKKDFSLTLEMTYFFDFLRDHQLYYVILLKSVLIQNHANTILVFSTSEEHVAGGDPLARSGQMP
jgi:hypothetical protein